MLRSKAARIDVIAGATVVAIAASALYQAVELDPGTLRSFGPGMLPIILASALLICGAAILVGGLVQKGPAVVYFHAAARGPALIGLAILVFALTIKGSDVAGLQLPQLGLAVIGPLTVILAGYGSAEAEPGDLATAGFGLTAFCLALFNDVLGMSIPILPGMVEALLADVLAPETLLRGAYGLCAVTAALLLAFRRARPVHA